MKLPSHLITLAFAFLAFPTLSLASELPKSLILKTDFRIWELTPAKLDVFSDYQKIDFGGVDVSLNHEDSHLVNGLINQKKVAGIDSMKVRHYLQSVIAPAIDREKTDVTIDMDEAGNILFEGTGLYGRQLNIEAATKMMEHALKNDMTYIHLPLTREDPMVTILNPRLKEMGIKELVSSGETDFSHSPNNRIHNINTGLSKFKGHMVNPGEEFSFAKTLGPVDGSTGYLKELVIKGNKTVPEHGGGLCQVSTTAYRAVLSAGFPITARRNHSYLVSYYEPKGLDATVYLPAPDMRFVNDTKHHLIMQSFTINSKAYYNFFGTKTNRKVHMIGPYYSGWKSAPSTKIEYSESLAPGERKVVGHAVPGVNVSWYRHVDYNDEENTAFLESIHSKYQARPDYFIVGKEASSKEPVPAGENGT